LEDGEELNPRLPFSLFKKNLPTLGGREAVKKSKTQSQDGGISEKM
jgi:hypothetical protein